MLTFVTYPGAADIKIQPKYPEFLLDMRCFCTVLLVSLGIRPRSRRCAERTSQGEGRWSHLQRRRPNEEYSTRIPVPRIAYLSPDENKLLTETLKSKNDVICIYVCIQYSGLTRLLARKHLSIQIIIHA